MKHIFNSDMVSSSQPHLVSVLMTFEVRRRVFCQEVEGATTTLS